MGRKSAIEITNVKKLYAGQPVLDVERLQVESGSFLCLLGPSGCGKTTLLRILAGLETADAGRVTLGGRVVVDAERRVNVPPRDRGVGMVFQSYALWPHMSVRRNIEWPLETAGWNRAQIAGRVDECLAMSGIQSLADRFPAQLSGGQQQRVAIARSIAVKPDFLLFDEPLSALDAQLRTYLRAELAQLHRETGGTYVYVTHDQTEALTMASHVAVLQNGRVEQFGTPADIVNQPQTCFVAGFIGMPASNLLPVNANYGHFVFDKRIVSACPAGLPNGAYTLLYRVESIRAETRGDGTGLTGTVIECLPFAGRTIVVLDLAGTRFAMVQDDQAAPVGSTVTITLPAAPSAVFSSSGLRV